MADWQRSFTVSDVWDTDDIHLIAKTAVDRMDALEPLGYPFIDDRKDELVKELRFFSTWLSAGKDDFNDLWNEVYDWGDISLDNKFNGKKVCFIDTMGMVDVPNSETHKKSA